MNRVRVPDFGSDTPFLRKRPFLMPGGGVSAIKTARGRPRAEHVEMKEVDLKLRVRWDWRRSPTRRSVGATTPGRIQPAIAPARRSGRSGSRLWNRLGIGLDGLGDASSSRYPSDGSSRATRGDTDHTARRRRGMRSTRQTGIAGQTATSQSWSGTNQPDGGDDAKSLWSDALHYQGCRSRAKSSRDFVSGPTATIQWVAGDCRHISQRRTKPRALMGEARDVDVPPSRIRSPPPPSTVAGRKGP